MIDLIGKFHPLVVHFPIALVLVAGLGALLGRRLPALAGAVGVLTTLAAVGAVFAGLTGWAFAAASAPAGETATVLEWHRWSGTVAAVVVVVAALMVGRGQRQVPWLVVAGAAVAVTGHLGGTLVFGDDHWAAGATSSEPPTAHVPAPPPPPTPAPAQPEAVATDAGVPAAPAPVEFASVASIFKRSCVRCHEVRKKKGGLRLDDRAAAMAGGETGAAIVPGNARGSLLAERIALPIGAKGHMPSKGDPLSADDIALITRWIDEGARWP